MGTEDYDNDQQALSEDSHRSIRLRSMKDDCLCTFCPPNRGENASRKPRHGTQKKKKSWR